VTEKTMTFTAREAYDPGKLATFTLQNGSVSLDFGEKLLQQVQEALDSMSDDDANVLQSAAKPAVSASLQKLLEPFPLQDFVAKLEGDALQVRAWVRAGGLRLAPIMLHWEHVDNPEGAAAFVAALAQRQEATNGASRLPRPLDYWAIWALMGITAVLVPILLWRQRARS